jgi:flagellar hook assembly protein FlgD
VRAQVMSAGSQVVRDLDRGRAATRGVNSLVWDGKDNKGASVPAGPYLLKLTASDDKGHQATVTVPVLVAR